MQMALGHCCLSGAAIEFGGSDDDDDVAAVLLFLLCCGTTEDHPPVCNEVKQVDLVVESC